MNSIQNILVVDDTNENLTLLCELLSIEGYKTLPADSGELALNALKNNTPDLILLDIRMPGMNGFEVCKKIKQNEILAEIPIIFLTAAIEIQDKLEGLRLGAVDFITKPFHKEELLLRVKTHLSIRQKELEMKCLYNELETTTIIAKDNERKLVEAQELAHIGNFLFDISTQSVQGSEELFRIFGFTKDEFEFNSFANSVHPDQREFVEETIKKTVNEGIGYDIEHYLICKDKTKKFIRAIGEPILDKNGKTISIVGTIQDLTKQKQAAEKTKETENEFRSTVNNLPVGVVVHAPDTSVILSNPRSHEILGLTKDQMLGKKTIDPAWKFVHKDGRTMKVEDYPVSLVISTNKPINDYILGIIKPKKDSITWVNVSALPVFDTNGYFKKIIVNFNDITEQKQASEKIKQAKEFAEESEEKYRLLFERETDAIFIFDPETSEIIEANNATSISYGYSSEELIGKSILEFSTHVEYSSKHMKKLNDEGKTRNVQAKHKKKDGTSFYVEINGYKINLHGKDLMYIVSKDVTKQKHAEQELIDTFEEVNKLKRQLEQENVYLREELKLNFSYEDMVYASEEFSDVLSQVELVAPTDATVLIQGETGTGKELIARAIHNIGPRKEKPLIKINCAAIPRDLIESELFGHVKGSFTGAIKTKPGKFELADGGTLFMDEIGEMPLELQPKILRALQEGEIEQIGGSGVRKVDIRVIAATNKDLNTESREGRFRKDLYFRLNVFPIFIPPLRQRVDDIPVLLEYFTNKYATKHGKVVNFISDTTMKQLQAYKWRGNVRELENAVERAIILSKDETLVFPNFTAGEEKRNIKSSGSTMEEMQRKHITKVLQECNWVVGGKDGAATSLGMKPSTLRDRMKKYNVIRVDR